MDTVYRLRKDQAEWLLRLCDVYQEGELPIGLLGLSLRRQAGSLGHKVPVPMGVIKAGLSVIWQQQAARSNSLITLITNVGFKSKSGFDKARGMFLDKETLCSMNTAH
jgi:hypothetical protein